MPPFTAQTDGPPPSPATSPAAAQETGLPISQLTPPVSLQPAGPDLSGVLSLGQKLDEGLLALSQAVPMISSDIDQIRSLLTQALGRFSSQATGTGTSSRMPLSPQPTQPGQQPQGTPPPNSTPPRGMVVSQAGPQFPGGGMSQGRPF